MVLHLTSIVSHHEPEDATQQSVPPATSAAESAYRWRCGLSPHPPAVRPQSLAREAYEAAWRIKESLR